MKKGITISILVVTVVLMFIIVTTATVIGTRTIQTASYEEFMSKIYRVSNDVNKYVMDNKSLPTTSEVIAKEGLSNVFKEELNKKKDVWNNLFVIDMTKLRTESVNIGKGTVEDMDVFVVAENTNNVYYLKGVNYKGATYHGIPIEEVNNIPQEWMEYVVEIVDEVPIPKGFVASQATGETSKASGLVIYEGTEAVTDVNVENARRTRNQYVWVPVDDFTKFIRQNFGLDYTLTNIVGTGSQYWEVELNEIINMPVVTQNTTYISSNTLLEVQKMYASINEYDGFYIARYEAGIDEIRLEQGSDAKLLPRGENVYSRMNKIPYVYVPWSWTDDMKDDQGGAVEIARSIYPSTNTNYSVASTLVYGVQWDAVLQWWLDTKVVTSVTESKTYGNYMESVINSSDELNEGAKVSVGEANNEYLDKDKLTYPKSAGVFCATTTGALKVAKINNIYDMAGNVIEWTMEARSTYARNARGGRPGVAGEDMVAQRYHSKQGYGFGALGFRTALYIKIDN